MHDSIKKMAAGTPVEGLRLYAVEWEDAGGDPHWHSAEDEIKKPIRCVLAGFLREKTKNHIKVSAGGSTVGQLDYTIIIPRANVKKMVPL